jgi:hypothetical protein
VPALLTACVHSVGTDLTVLVFKNKGCQFEADTVFALILEVLAFVLLVAHLYIHSVAQIMLR